MQLMSNEIFLFLYRTHVIRIVLSLVWNCMAADMQLLVTACLLGLKAPTQHSPYRGAAVAGYAVRSAAHFLPSIGINRLSYFQPK